MTAARMTHGRKLLTVSNRGPMEFNLTETGEIVAVPGSGGLATALRSAAALSPRARSTRPRKYQASQ